MIECPKHEGSYDCTPFCDICEGEQEYLPSKQLTKETRAITLTPNDLANVARMLKRQKITGMNLALVIDLLASPDIRETAAAL